MIRSTLAVVAGFAVAAIMVILTTTFIVVPVAWPPKARTPHAKPASPGRLAAVVLPCAFLSGAAGSMAARLIAPGRPAVVPVLSAILLLSSAKPLRESPATAQLPRSLARIFGLTLAAGAIAVLLVTG